MNALAIVMRAKNEMPHATRALAALRSQRRTDWTLFAVDSGSTDGTLQAIREFLPFRLEEILPADYEPGPVLNRMIALTTEPIVVLLNADAVPLDDRWLENLVAPIEAGIADATMSVQVPRPDAELLVADDYRRAYDPKNIKPGNEDFFSAVACAFRRGLWEDRPFKSKGYSEDLAWARECRAAGARFLLVPDSRVEHSHNYTLRELHTKRYRHGRAFVAIFGSRPEPLRQTLACAREMARDLLLAARHGHWTGIPFHLAYRFTIHRALYLGLRDETREKR